MSGTPLKSETIWLDIKKSTDGKKFIGSELTMSFKTWL